MKIDFQKVPVHAQYNWINDDVFNVTLIFLQNHWIQRFFRKIFRMKIPSTSRIQFDEKTSYIWNLIDGERTLREIYMHFSEKYNDEQKDLENRFGTVIHYFFDNKWIKFKEIDK